MGHVGCAHLSVISQCCCWLDCQSILRYHVPVVCTVQRYQRNLAVDDLDRAWPQPVLLKHIEEGPLNVRVWNPKVRDDALRIESY